MSIKSLRNYFSVKPASGSDAEQVELPQYGQLGRIRHSASQLNISPTPIVSVPNHTSTSSPSLLSSTPPSSPPKATLAIPPPSYPLATSSSRSESPSPSALSHSQDSVPPSSSSRKKLPPPPVPTPARLSTKSSKSMHFPRISTSAPSSSSSSSSSSPALPPTPPPNTRLAGRVPTVSNILALAAGPAATAVIVDINKSLRDQYLNRFLVAEKSYLRSLHVILVCYMHPMSSPEADSARGLSSLSSEDINMVFRNIVELRKAHSLFLRNLISRTKLWTSSSQFGDVVYNHIEATELLYRQYIDGLPQAIAKLDEMLKHIPDLAFQLRGCEALADGMRRTETEDEMKDFTLRGLLHEPVLIIHKYFALLQGIRKALKADDPDVYHLGKSLAVIAPLTLIQVPSLAQSIPQEQDVFLDYSVKVANFNEFRKTATKVIKSARKLADHEAERLHEHSLFTENLVSLQTAYEYSISPELGGALGNYAALWKKLGDLRSEMHARQKKSFIGPLMADLETFEKVFTDLEKQHTITQAANQDYQHARQKAMRNPQGGKKLSLELSSHYQKRVVTNARREFDALFDVATALQEKVLLHLHAGLQSQITFHEQATSHFASNKESIDAVQNYLQSVERSRWMKNLHTELQNAFSTPVVVAAGEEHPDYGAINMDFDWLLKPWPAPAPLPMKLKYQPLSDLLASQTLALVNSIAVTCGDDQPRVLDSVVRILDYHNSALDTIRKSITQEVAATSAPTTLFRTNTITTKLMSAHSRVALSAFLTPLIPLIKEVLSNPDGFEVDPTKLREPGQLEANLQTLTNMAQRFLEAIISRVDEWPLSVKIVAKHLQHTVGQRFNDAKLKNGVLGGYTFLRFLCPSILSPTWADVDSPSPAASRALLFVTKVLQALANGQEFGAKEAFMKPINPFVVDNTQKIEQFYDKLTSVDDNVNVDSSSLVSDELIGTDLHSLHSLINKNMGKIVKSLYLYGHKSDIPKLVVIIVNLGDPTYY